MRQRRISYYPIFNIRKISFPGLHVVQPVGSRQATLFAFFNFFNFFIRRSCIAVQFIALFCHYFILVCVFSDTASAPLFLICWLCWFPLFISPSQFRYCSNNTHWGLFQSVAIYLRNVQEGLPWRPLSVLFMSNGVVLAHMFLLTKWGGRDEQGGEAHSPNDRGALAVSEKNHTRKWEGKSEW